jgi:glycogen debranching enzyme
LPAVKSGLTIARAPDADQPFTVQGDRGAILGRQDGSFEAWIFPVKILSGFRISAVLGNSGGAIDVNAHARSIEVAPAATTITYSHPAFTIRQRMFAPRGDRAGAIALFEVDSARPLRLTFRFTPQLLRMWPAPGIGPPRVQWLEQRGGYYRLETAAAGLSAAVALPGASPGPARAVPLEFNLAYDPERDRTAAFPLLLALGRGHDDLGRELEKLNGRVPDLYSQTERYYAHFFDTRLTTETPDPDFDRAMRWAEIAIDQAQVDFHGETGLVAGYQPSGDSSRPGFAWFFGRDTLWTAYAINSYGDFALTRKALQFLIRRQRADGKVMHEFSQTADLVDWAAMPYYFAAADSTPLFVMAMEDYGNASGDLAFLRKHWDAIKRAYAFTRAHADSNGIYENTEGTGWVEEWPRGMPHQETYLAALDEQSAEAMWHLAARMRDASLATTARHASERIRTNLEHQFYDPVSGVYAFSRNQDGTLDTAATMFPSVAWWTGRLSLPRAENMLNRWASPEFSTGWGVRGVSNREPIYNPVAYHAGSVWPLFTGWVSLAEYRAGHGLAGYMHLMQNVNLTWTQNPGAVTELLSGDEFQPLPRSTSHQTWSSAMVLTPGLRGLFGLDWDSLDRTLRLAPHLPANWDRATLRNVPLGRFRVELSYRREAGRLVIEARSSKPEVFCLVAQTDFVRIPCSAPPRAVHQLRISQNP